MIRESMRLFDWYLVEIKRLKTCSKTELHRKTYRFARKKFPLLKSAHIQSVRDHACAVAKRFNVHNGGCAKINKRSLSMAINNRAFSFKGNVLRYTTPTRVVKAAILAGRERRFTTDTLHCITKKVVEESACVYRHHADINAALNIQSLSIREGQAAVNRPNVASRAYSPTPRWVAA